MLEGIGSRRAVIGAGVAVAGAAMLAPLAFRGGRVAAGADGITVVPGGASAFADDPVELGRWTSLVGRPVRVAGSLGVIEAVEPAVAEGPRPAGIRRQPFTVRFALDAATAPAGDAIYDVGTAVDGLTRLFLQRAGGTAGRATLTALFN